MTMLNSVIFTLMMTTLKTASSSQIALQNAQSILDLQVKMFKIETSMEALNDTIDEELTQFTDEVTDIRNASDALARKDAALEKQITALEMKNDQLEQTVSSLEMKNNQLEQTVSALEMNNNKLEQTVGNLEQALTRLEASNVGQQTDATDSEIVDEMIADMNKTVEELKKKDEDLENQNTKLDTKVSELKSCTSSRVAFRAFLPATGEYQLPFNSVVGYTDVQENVNNNYSPSTSTFTPDIAGLYKFNLHAFSQIRSDAYLYIAHNGRRTTSISLESGGDTARLANSASTSVVLHLNVGDRVNVVSHYGNPAINNLFQDNGTWHTNVFSGELLQSDKCRP